MQVFEVEVKTRDPKTNMKKCYVIVRTFEEFNTLHDVVKENYIT